MKTTNHKALRSLLSYFIIVVGLLGCSNTTSITDPLNRALNSEDVRIRKVMDDPSPFEVQIRFTRISREKDSVYFEDYDYNVDSTLYFYPASTVKFPIALLALEKINRNKDLSINTRFYVEGDSLETTFAEEITKIFAVSDNDANNRLLEFLGQDAINASFKEKKIGPARISHRLSVPEADEVTTRPLVIYLNDSTTTLLPNSVNTPPKSLNLIGIGKGQGFYEGDSLIKGSFDFSKKNYYPISTQHGVLKRIVFPEVFPKNERFDLSDDQRNFLLNAMQAVPREVGYSAEDYYDSYGKFFIYGDSKEQIPSHMRIYNKVGYAYGTLTDCAYIKDEKNEVEFMLTATILVNADGVFNDNEYEYEEIGIPFLTALGSELYKTELKR
ncbi:MAG: class A beta-lactamase-related serine hydrolase [Muriicola sp.]|nr:class A beta-lactamase-related serine hydrolase [Muriicola sp.]